MKRKIITPKVKENTREALVNFLSSNGMTTWGANQFMYVNIPALGERRTLEECIEDNDWDTAWNVAEMYLRGDFNA